MARKIRSADSEETVETKAKRIAAPPQGLPDAIASAIIACVVPQGIKIVKAPRIAGANRFLLFDSLRTSLVKNRGGWIIK